MIEVVTYPTDLNKWDAKDSQPYLELYGETQPLLCTDLAETLSSGSADSADSLLQTAVATPIYEYFWTIGISENVRDRLSSKHLHVGNPGNLIPKHDDWGAEVWLCFPLTVGWRVYEVVATVRHLKPLPHVDNLIEKVADYWKTVAPVVNEAATVNKYLPYPGSAITSNFLSMLTRLQITAIPPVDGFAWSVDKVTYRMESEVVDGVHWKLPKKMFKELGSRLTGSIAVYFHPAHIQKDTVAASVIQPQPQAILAQTVVHDPDGDQWAPSEKEHIRLHLAPRLNK